MAAQTGYFDTLKSVAGKVFTFLASITLTGTDGKIITVTQDTSLDEAVAMSSKAPLASPAFTGDVTLAGKAVNTTLPAFLVRPTAEQANFAANTPVTVVFGTEIFDQGANFAANVFTAPVAGKYLFNWSVYMQNVDSAAVYYVVTLNTSNRIYDQIFSPLFSADAPFFSLGSSILADMDAGDTAWITVFQSGGAAQTDIQPSSFFSGHLVC